MSEKNPYAAPTATADPLDPVYVNQPWIPVASQNKRLLNYIVDIVITRVISAAAGFLMGLAYGAYLISSGRDITESDETLMSVLGFVLGITIFVVYYAGMESLFGATIGKLATGTRVVTADGSRASTGQIIGRSFARMIPFEPFSFLFGDTTTGWHDTLSGTKVIDIRASR